MKVIFYNTEYLDPISSTGLCTLHKINAKLKRLQLSSKMRLVLTLKFV